MELTAHAIRRIYDRTKLFTKDALSIVTDGAVVNLGSHKGCGFLLFYSPPDNVCKIAVVSEDRRYLVSIWEKSFKLPAVLPKITPKLEREAKRLFQEFIFEKIRPKDLPKMRPTKKPTCSHVEEPEYLNVKRVEAAV